MSRSGQEPARGDNLCFAVTADRSSQPPPERLGDAVSLVSPLLLRLSPLLLAGCLGLAREAPDLQTFAIEVEREPAKARASQSVVLVEPVRVAAMFAGKPFVYRTAPHTWTSDYYRGFLARPEDTLTAAARAWLAAAGFQVVAPGSRVAPTHALEIEVAQLYGDYGGAPDQAVLALRATLVSAAQERVLWQRSYRSAPELSDRAPATLAAGFGTALRAVLDQLEADLRPHLVD
jgi:uncharacterized lipoprotein YmbA